MLLRVHQVLQQNMLHQKWMLLKNLLEKEQILILYRYPGLFLVSSFCGRVQLKVNLNFFAVILYYQTKLRHFVKPTSKIKTKKFLFLVEKRGLTAYGLFLEQVQSTRDFLETFGMVRSDHETLALAQILKPNNGGTDDDKELERRLLEEEEDSFDF